MYRFDEDGRRRDVPLLSPAFLGLVDHAFFRCPFACIDDLVTASASEAAGISESDINKFLTSMAEDHTHAKAAQDLRTGTFTVGWIFCWH